jgi:hypothetical protein
MPGELAGDQLDVLRRFFEEEHPQGKRGHDLIDGRVR